MGLAVRIIPTILCRGREQVKGERFNAWRSVGLVEQSVRIHQARGVDELVLLDIGATPEGRGPDLALVEKLTEGCFMPLAVGGGVRTVQHVKDLLRAGADKVVIGTGLFEPTLLKEIVETVGSQAVVVAIDYKANETYVECGRRACRWSPRQAAIRASQHGAGEILLTSMDREAFLNGYDRATLVEVSEAVTIPVIAHGGCGTYQHMLEAVQAGASAVAAGAMFQFTDATPRGAAEYLRANGVETRVP